MRIKEALKAANERRSKSTPRITAGELALKLFEDSDASDRSKISMLSKLSKSKFVDIKKLKIVAEYTGCSIDFLLGFSDEPFN